MRKVWGLAIALAAAACGGSGSSADAYTGLISCTQIEDVAGFGALQVCEEAMASARSPLQQGCTSPTAGGGRAPVVDAPCSRTNTLGGCQITSGGFAESFWYAAAAADAQPGATAADIQMLCASAGGTMLTSSTQGAL